MTEKKLERNESNNIADNKDDRVYIPIDAFIKIGFYDGIVDKFTAYLYLTVYSVAEPKTEVYQGKEIPLEKGEIILSVDKFAKDWKWNESEVMPFIERLHQEDLIKMTVKDGVTVLLSCNMIGRA